MNIYIAHSSAFDFQNELYRPIQEGDLYESHKIILPHLNSSEPFNSKEFFENDCDLIIAEVSYPSTGMGIELGWANILKVPVLLIHKEGTKISSSLKVISNNILSYSSSQDLIAKISKWIH